MQAGQLLYLGVQMRMRIAVGTVLPILWVPVPQGEFIPCSRVDPIAVGKGRDLPRPALTRYLNQVVLLLDVQ